MKRAFQIGFLKEQGLQPGDGLLDLGCGTLRGGLPLIEFLDSGNYTGVDVREDAIAEPRKGCAAARLEDRQPRLEVLTELETADLGQQFEVIWAFQVVIHMTDEILAGAVGFIDRHLAPGGRAFVSVRIGQLRRREWQGFPAMTRPLEAYQQAFGASGLVVSDVGPLTEHGHVLSHLSIEQQAPQRMLLVTRP